MKHTAHIKLASDITAHIRIDATRRASARSRAARLFAVGRSLDSLRITHTP